MRFGIHHLRGLESVGVGLFFALALLGGCDSREDSGRGGDATRSASVVPPRVSDPVVLARGKRLFEQHCAVCHGAEAQGSPNGRFRGPDGKFPPPPLNGTAHSWHHPRAWLRQLIKSGSPPGQGNMPAWDDKMSDKDVDAIIDWFQSLWPEPLYEAWVRIERRSTPH